MTGSHSNKFSVDDDKFGFPAMLTGRSPTDLIEELIEEDEQRLAAPLPRPPPPPTELLCESGGGSHRRPRQNSSPPSQPLLVARGTACQVGVTAMMIVADVYRQRF